MEYTKIISLRNDLLLKHTEPEDPRWAVLTNTIDRYNFFVEQYNLTYNIVKNTKMTRVSGGLLYRIGYTIEKSLVNFLIVLGFVPTLFLVFKMCFTDPEWLYFTLLTMYMGFICFISLMTLLIYFHGKRTYERNLLLVANPFQRMIYSPDICRILNLNNVHLEFPLEELEKLNLTATQKKQIESNVDYTGKAKFMVYDQDFIEYYSQINKRTGTLMKHVIWVIASFGFFILYVYLLTLIK